MPVHVFQSYTLSGSSCFKSNDSTNGAAHGYQISFYKCSSIHMQKLMYHAMRGVTEKGLKGYG